MKNKIWLAGTISSILAGFLGLYLNYCRPQNDLIQVSEEESISVQEKNTNSSLDSLVFKKDQNKEEPFEINLPEPTTAAKPSEQFKIDDFIWGPKQLGEYNLPKNYLNRSSLVEDFIQRTDENPNSQDYLKLNQIINDLMRKEASTQFRDGLFYIKHANGTLEAFSWSSSLENSTSQLKDYERSYVYSKLFDYVFEKEMQNFFQTHDPESLPVHFVEKAKAFWVSPDQIKKAVDLIRSQLQISIGPYISAEINKIHNLKPDEQKFKGTEIKALDNYLNKLNEKGYLKKDDFKAQKDYLKLQFPDWFSE